MFHLTKFAGGTAAVLAVAFLLCAGAVFFSEDTDAVDPYTDSNGVVYTLGDTTATVSGCDAAKLPSDGKLTIPASITVGGKDYSVTEISYSAFEECTALTLVAIPDSVTRIYGSSFFCCTALTAFTVADGNKTYDTVDGALYTKDLKTLVACPGAFTALTIPAGVTEIGDYACYDCISLTSVVIPDSVTAIGKSAFAWCTALTSAVIPAGVTEIGDYTFYHCTALTSVKIGESVKTIGHEAFFCCTALTSVVIPDSVTSFGYHAFYKCTALTSVKIGEKVKAIDSELFYGCTALTVFTVADSNPNYCAVDGVLYTKDMKTLVRCPAALTAVTIPDTVTAIANWSFESSKIASVTIPDSVTSLGYYAFYKCNALTTVNIPAGVTSYGVSFAKCAALTAFTVADDNPKFCAVDGVLYTKDMKTLLQCPLCFTSLIIPDSVTLIAEGALRSSALTSVVIGEKVETIDFMAFYDCQALTSVYIPDNVTDLGQNAFNECTALTSLYVGSGAVFGWYPFDYDFYTAAGKILAEDKVGGYCYQFGKIGTEDGFIRYDGGLVTVIAATEGGTLTGGGLYAVGASVTVTATAADGYSVTGWYNGETKLSDETSYTFSLAGNVTYTAEFSKNAEPSGGSNTWIWIVVVIVVILVVLLAVYFLFIRTGKLKL